MGMEAAVFKGSPVVYTGEHGSTGYPTHVLTVEIGKTNPGIRKSIQIWSLDLATKATKVGVAHVVGHDEENVWLCPQGSKSKKTDKR